MQRLRLGSLTGPAHSAYGERMPSPLGHALGGLIVGLLGAERSSRSTTSLTGLWSTPAVLLASAAAVAPDLDFLWGRHNMETHSFGAAALAAMAVLLWTRGRGARLAVIVGLAWSSHVLFDWLGSDTTPPLGVMALWPFSNAFYFADAFVFDAISRRTQLPNFWSHNLWAVVKEAALLAPGVAVAAWWTLRRRL
jgi:membrane-bound metal-dependent hydrolase YbcI (DUF457 family)